MPSSTDNNLGYLLIHKSGSIERIQMLTNEHQELIKKGLKIIDLESLELFNQKIGWERLPLLNAEGVEIQEEEHEEEIQEEEEGNPHEYDPFRISRGAKRCFNPYIVWNFGRGFR